MTYQRGTHPQLLHACSQPISKPPSLVDDNDLNSTAPFTIHAEKPLSIMLSIPWKQEINFTSALLLHSCITIFLKELSNSVAILYHLTLRGTNKAEIGASVVLDGYTSIFSRDSDGELAELYFTNTGFALLVLSLASAIAMNLTLPTKALNVLIAATFGLTFVASALVACRRRSLVMPIMALRRAGRFIWSDTPFVNFFSLIYIAVVLKGTSRLALRDYVTFRSIAILELLFMKARLAASDPATQQTMLRRLIDSEYIMIKSVSMAHGVKHQQSFAVSDSCRKFLRLR